MITRISSSRAVKVASLLFLLGVWTIADAQTAGTATGTSTSGVGTTVTSFAFPGIGGPAMPRKTFVYLGENVEPVGLAVDGTITFRVWSYTEATRIGRWKNGVTTFLEMPASLYAYSTASTPDGERGVTDPRSGLFSDSPGDVSWGRLGRDGTIIAPASDYFDDWHLWPAEYPTGYSENFVVGWSAGATAPFAIKGVEVTRNDAGNEPYGRIVRSNAAPVALGGINQIWVGGLAGVVGPLTYAGTAAGSPAFPLIQLADVGSRDIDEYWLSVYQVNSAGQALGTYRDSGGQKRFFVGSPATPVDYTALAINDSGSVLGDEDPIGGGEGDRVLSADIYGANLLYWNYGYYPTKPFVVTAGAKKYLQGIAGDPPMRISGFDDAGNVYGSFNPDYYSFGDDRGILVNPGKSVLWVADPTAWGLPVGTPPYTPIPWRSPELPSGFMPSENVPPDARRIDLGIATRTEPDGTVTYHGYALIPAGLAIDANRDGVIALASDDASEATSAAKPYLFWLNDDDDSTIAGGVIKDTVPAARPDWQGKWPASARDMEDFARLWISTSGITESLKPKSDGSADLYLGLKWSDTGGTNPGIRVFRHRETDGGTRYLTDESAAYDQSLESCILDASGPSSSLDQEGIVTGTQVYVLEPRVFATLSDSQPVSHLLFEGCKVGKGQLKIVILKKQAGSFTTIGEGPGIWLDLMNIKSMYERAVATTGGPRSENGVDYTIPVPPDLNGPDDNNIPHPTMGWASNDLGYPFRPDPAETKNYIIYVHGWRWSPEKANNRTETVFKRLWHLGYKGRLAALRWPTFYGGPDDDDSEPAGIFTYNNSEYRAWKSGESLKLYVNQLPSGYARHVVAHSMGNIVTGAALKKGMSVANYIMLNAAVPALCYDESTSLRQPDWNYATPNTDPDASTRALAYTGKFGTLNTNVVNFFLSNDSATRTLWEINNSTWRPQRYNLGTTGYGYDPAAILGRRLYITFFTSFGRFLIDPHEAMPYACQSLTRTAGADGRTRGSIGSVVDMDASFGFGDEHGAEWERGYAATRAFYVELMRTLQIPAQP